MFYPISKCWVLDKTIIIIIKKKKVTLLLLKWWCDYQAVKCMFWVCEWNPVVWLFSVSHHSRGDWLGKPATIKGESNGAVGYVGSSLTVHNPLYFVHKFRLNKLMQCLILLVSIFKMIGMLLKFVHGRRSKKANENILQRVSQPFYFKKIGNKGEIIIIMISPLLPIFLTLIISLVIYCICVAGVAAYIQYLCHIDRLQKRAFRFRCIQRLITIHQVVKERDYSTCIMGNC